MNREQLIKKSKEILLQYQSPNGAFIACPNFGAYSYSWLRDGSFIAYALDVCGEYDAAARFYRWVHQAISGQKDHLDRLIGIKRSGEEPSAKDFLPARYTLEGRVADDEWPNFQLDGYGTWLWGLHEHVKMSGDDSILQEVEDSIRSCFVYLSNFWMVPNYDCWEEFGDRVHLSTLACIYGGAAAMAERFGDQDWKALADTVREFILRSGVENGRFAKSVGFGNVDASLLWLNVPFGAAGSDDETMQNTVREIEEKLHHQGGVHRYPEDTYYGGGEWLLLSSWLGWYYARSGDRAKAEIQLDWVERQADERGWMTEQVLDHVNEPRKVQEWFDFWGEVANPLLWSHAMYLVLCAALGYIENERKV